MTFFLIIKYLADFLIMPVCVIFFANRIEKRQKETNRQIKESIDSKQNEALLTLSQRIEQLEIALAELVSLFHESYINQDNYSDS